MDQPDERNLTMTNCNQSSTDSGENSATQAPLPSLSPQEKARALRKAWEAKNPDYQKKRRDAIKAGSWAFRHKVNTSVTHDASPCSSELSSASYGPSDAPGT